ncbi:1-deoxy-D-xylulose-5-phosphate synthase [Turicibacter sanguinis]|uniref:1-deoxy-D-xylulose-5-phosphate synthase n=1 Tax=Turicibacter sanguinis TaxID=154288 RepID=UPI0018A9CE98|nr:1-deoxy-D-xylulose-5-phosphate synthase [Turicibacter sanguinis]MDB8563699.1 1-deoxy-D-xylulose-5-phosphate synthase [Turicibacter sanguinis]
MYNIKEIQDPTFIKQLSNRQLKILCKDLRTFLIDSLSKTGGHLSSNLGVVELTVALHKVFNSPEDKFIWDVGHQSYIHKILTGRAKDFPTLRQYKGLSGFPKRKESSHDCWETGHASTSISAAVGMAYARDLNEDDYHVIAIIGDGSLTGGMAYEALNHIGHTNKRLIVILNDNEMAISPNVGALHNILGTIRTTDSYLNTKRQVKAVLKENQVLNGVIHRTKGSVKRLLIGNTPFDALGFKYFGPVDGHNLNDLIKNLNFAKKADKPVLIHVKTTKGKGFSFAEQDKLGTWHGVGKFNKRTGNVAGDKKENQISWSKLISNGLMELTAHDKRCAVITPAMINGSALNEYAKRYPDRLIDVGIAEEHAVTMAGGMATQGMKPFVSIYSTFLKRSYDQIHHDIARQNLDVVFGIDRAGIVGADGETHQGLYDIAMLRPVPNMTLMMPRNGEEAYNLLYTAYQTPGPFAMRYPRGDVWQVDPHYHEWKMIEIGSWEWLATAQDAVIVSMGPVLSELAELVEELKLEGLHIGLVNARFIKPLDYKMLDEIAALQVPIIVYEESTLIAGLGSAILEYYNETNQRVEINRLGIPDIYVQHGRVSEILEELHLTIEDVKLEVMRSLKK